MRRTTTLLKLLSLAALYFGLSINANAQFTLGGGIGATAYSGDVAPIQVQNTRPALGIDLGYKFSEMFQLIGSANWYYLKGDDKSKYTNRSFTSSNIDAFAQVRIFLTKPRSLYSRANAGKIVPYIAGGVGITTMDPRSAAGTSFGTQSLASLKPEGKDIPSMAVIYPLSLGIRFRLSHGLYLYTDATVRIVGSDMLDGASSDKVIPTGLSAEAKAYNKEIAAQVGNSGLASSQDASYAKYTSLSYNAGKSVQDWENAIAYKNGNPAMGDFYGTFSFKLEYRFESKATRYKYKGRSGGARHQRRPSRLFK